MFYPQDVIEEVRIGNDIVDVIGQYTSLKRSGSGYMGLCPFHRENSPSFSVSDDKQLYHCFGCGASGNVISFIMQKENYDFVDTIKYLAGRINYTLPEAQYSGDARVKNEVRNTLYEMHKKAARHFYDNLSSVQGKIAVDYLDKRNIFPSVRRKYGLGYSMFRRDDLYRFLKEEGYSDELLTESGLVIKGENGGFYDRFANRLMFPIIDVQGRIIGFGGRSLDVGEGGKKTAKYLNSPDTPVFNKSNNLYSINFARLSKTRELILVEGYMDVITLYQAGFHNAVAALGTAFNENHAKLLKRYADKVIILFDSDEAGVKAVLRAIPVIVGNGIKAKVLQVTDAKDPDEYINKYGASGFAELVKTAKSHISFLIENELKNYDLNDTSQIIDFTKEAAKIIASLSSPVERDVYIKQTANITSISYEAIEKEVKNAHSQEAYGYRLGGYAGVRRKTGSTGLEDAKRSIVNICTLNEYVGRRIAKLLKPEELIDKLYEDILRIIYEMYEQNKTFHPAELVSLFDDIQQQKRISSIFMLKLDFEDEEALYNAVNDWLKLIRKAYIDAEISKETDLNRLQELLKEKRNTETLNIML